MSTTTPHAESSSHAGRRARQTPYIRSRSGCLRCRDLKKKCDETAESCLRCLNATVDCVYPAPAPRLLPPMRMPGTADVWASVQLDETGAPPCSTGDGALGRLDEEDGVLGYQRESESALTPTRALIADLLDGFLAPTNPVDEGSATTISSLHSGSTSTQAEPGIWATWDSMGLCDLDAVLDASNVPARRPYCQGQVPQKVMDVLLTFSSSEGLSGLFLHSVVASKAQLLKYFYETVTRTITAIDDADNPCRTCWLPTMISTSRSSTADDATLALLHAVQCVSAIHYVNMLRSLGISADDSDIHVQRISYRHKAMSLLRAAATQVYNDPVADKRQALCMTGTIIALVLGSVLDGDAKTVPLLLSSAELPMERLITAYASPSSLFFIAIHSLYTLVNGIVRGEAVHSDQLWWSRTSSANGDPSADQCDKTVRIIMGASRQMLQVLSTAHNLALRRQAVARMSVNDDSPSLAWEAAEIEAELDAIDKAHADGQSSAWRRQWADGESRRVQIGHESYRLAIRIFVLYNGFGLSLSDHRIQLCVQQFITCVQEIELGTEVGLTWPLIIVGACARDEAHRGALLHFTAQCHWNGSAPSAAARTCLTNEWSTGKRWSRTLADLGYPTIL